MAGQGTMSPWKTAWRQIPPHLRQAMEAEDISNDDADAPSFNRMWEKHAVAPSATIGAIIDHAKALSEGAPNTTAPSPSQPRTKPCDTRALEHHMARLAQAAKATQRYRPTTTGMHDWLYHASAPRDHDRAAAASMPAPTAKLSYRPRAPKTTDHATQQDKDNAETRKWAERLLQALKPHPYPYLQQTPLYEDKLALLGSTRAATLRGHALTLEKTLTYFPRALLWREGTTEMEHISHMLRTMREQHYKPSRMQKAWKTLNWLGRTMGYGAPDTHSGLLAMYKNAQSRLERPLYKQSRKAKMPPEEVVQALEKGACDSSRTGAYRYYASMLRIQLGTSARYVDMQHTAPKTFQAQSRHIHMAPWQTKTTKKGATNLTRFIATKHSRTRLNWWEAAEATCAKFVAAHPDMDFMYPRLTEDKTGFVLQPASHSQVTSMYRHVLVTQGVPAKVAHSMSLHGLRVWAAEMAYQAQVPRDLRRYIGHWSQEKTADTYTREHAKIVTQIWRHIFDNYEMATDTARADVPDDPSALGFLETAVGVHDVHLIKQDLDERRPKPSRKRRHYDKEGNAPPEERSPSRGEGAPSKQDPLTPLTPPKARLEGVTNTAPPGELLPLEHTPTPRGDTQTPPPGPSQLSQPKDLTDPLPPTSPAPSSEKASEAQEDEDPDDAATAMTAMPDIDDHPLGPLAVARGNAKTKGTYRIHYVMPNLRTVGCNKLASPAKYTWITTARDYAELEDIQECHWCGQKARLPCTWTTRTTAPDAEKVEETTTSASDSSDSWSASTDSEAPRLSS